MGCLGALKVTQRFLGPAQAEDNQGWPVSSWMHPKLQPPARQRVSDATAAGQGMQRRSPWKVAAAKVLAKTTAAKTAAEAKAKVTRREAGDPKESSSLSLSLECESVCEVLTPSM